MSLLKSDESELKDNINITSWSQLNINDDILRGIYAYGFETPSPIQIKAIVPFLEGKDVLGQAQSGTGKTGAFSISILQRIDLTKKTQALVIAPTHELVQQIYNVINHLGSFMKNLKVKTTVGGTYVQEDISYITKNNPHIIIGTPGRIRDLISRNVIKGDQLTMLVMDEVDELLSSGFIDTIKSIVQLINKNSQIAMFTASLPPEIIELTKHISTKCVQITMNVEDISVTGIDHYYMAVYNDTMKYDMIKLMFETCVISQCIIYTNSISKVIDLYNQLIKEDYSVSFMHGELDDKERKLQFDAFKIGSSRILISSNITARGIDIQHVGMVINYDIPSNVHTYLHRVGRSGRYGRKGTAINLVSNYDLRNIKYIEQYYKINMKEYTM